MVFGAHTSWQSCTLSFSLAHRWPRSRSAPSGTDPGSGGRSSPLSHPAGSARGSRRRRSATGTSAGSGSPPGSAAAHNDRRCAGGRIPGMSLNWFWWFRSSQRPGTVERWVSECTVRNRWLSSKTDEYLHSPCWTPLNWRCQSSQKTTCVCCSAD